MKSNSRSDIFHSFVKTANRYKMFGKAKKVYVACSGGPDSVALTHLIKRFSQDRFEIGIIHINHGLRGKTSNQDEKWVERFASSLGIKFVSGRVNVKKKAKEERLSIEEAARDLRYQFLIQTAKRLHIDTVVLGHTMDDQAETVLMRFLGGTGLRGFGAARPVIEREKIKFIRPLIQISKKEILNFLKQEKISYRTDKTNQETKFLRNKIRHELLPYLENKFNPGIRKVLARLPEVIQNDADFLETEAKKQIQKLKRCHNGQIIFPKQKFQMLHPAIQFRLLYDAAREITKEEFAFSHWQAFQELFEKKLEFQTSFPGHLICEVSKSQIVIRFKKETNKSVASFRTPLQMNKKIQLPENQCELLLETVSKPASFKKKREDYAILDQDKIKSPLWVRYRKPGDLFQPLGQRSPSKLKDFLITRKIPREKRDQIPLVLSGNEIIWAAGVALTERVKATQNTKRFVKLQIFS